MGSEDEGSEDEFDAGGEYVMNSDPGEGGSEVGCEGRVQRSLNRGRIWSVCFSLIETTGAKLHRVRPAHLQ